MSVIGQKLWNSCDIGLREVGTRRCLNIVNKWRRKNPWKTFFAAQFYTLYEFSNLGPLLFPKKSENLKSLDIGLWKVGAKRPFNRREKVWQTNRQLYRQAYIRTFWLIEKPVFCLKGKKRLFKSPWQVLEEGPHSHSHSHSHSRPYLLVSIISTSAKQ